MATTNEKLSALISKYQRNNFSPVKYVVTLWDKPSKVIKTKFSSTATASIPYATVLSVEPNPSYEYGQNKFLVTYEEVSYESREFSSFKSAQAFVKPLIESLWAAYIAA